MSETKNWRVPPEPVPDGQIAEILEADVVIVGAGHAGSCAARAAAEEGASVIVIEQQSDEKQWVLGFEIGVINSKWGLNRGVPEYDPLDFVREWQRRTLGRSNAKLISKYAHHCGETLDWFIEPLPDGFMDRSYVFMEKPPEHYEGELNGIHGFLGTVIIRGTPGYELPEAVKINHEYSKKLGVRFLFETSGEYLTKDGARVTGVVCKRRDGSYILVKAKKGVLLAAGDFGKNPEMVRELCCEYMDLNNGEPGNGGVWDGIGVRMGVWAGARLEPRPIASGGGGGGNSILFGPAAFAWFNDKGRRYVDEGSSFAGSQGARQKGTRFCCVFDSDYKNALEYQGIDHGMLYMHSPEGFFEPTVRGIEGSVGKGAGGNDFAAGLGRGRVWSADTVEELIGYLGYTGEDAENLLDEIRRYNQFAYNKRDEDFAKDPRLLFPIDKPPFFGSVKGAGPDDGRPVMPRGTMTYGGLWIDDDQRVLDHNLDPIPGLYASGNTSGCRFGFQYFTPCGGVSIGIAQTLGRLAGQYIARS